jgi:hypothetical protein
MCDYRWYHCVVFIISDLLAILTSFALIFGWMMGVDNITLGLDSLILAASILGMFWSEPSRDRFRD